jgi:hypothetical protein
MFRSYAVVTPECKIYRHGNLRLPRSKQPLHHTRRPFHLRHAINRKAQQRPQELRSPLPPRMGRDSDQDVQPHVITSFCGQCPLIVRAIAAPQNSIGKLWKAWCSIAMECGGPGQAVVTTARLRPRLLISQVG